MTDLRPTPWLRLPLWTRGVFSLPAATAALGFGLLCSPGALAAPHAHARRPLPTPLRVTTVTAGSHHASAAHPGKTGTATRSKHGNKAAEPVTGRSGSRSASPAAGKKRKGRRETEPAEDTIPMFRARNGVSQRGHRGNPAPELSSQARVSRRSGGRSQSVMLASATHVRSALAAGPAPLAGRHGVPATGVSPSHAVRARAGDETRALASADREESPAPIERAQPYAAGISQPEGDERLMSATTPLVGGPGNSSVVLARPALPRVSAAPSPNPPATPVVQGFGGEVAIPSAAAGAPSANTHRRNHPSNWAPEALLSAPEPLEEREAITAAAVSPAVLPQTYDRDGRLVMPAPLRGSHEVLVHQNVMATNDGLERIQDDADLERLRAAHQLVGFPLSESLRINEDLPYNRRYARPWTVEFAADLGRAFYTRFHQPIQINSAVRTVHYQAHLQLINGNAAATYGDGASPHLTGQAIDIAKRWMTHEQIAWMRGYLAPWMQTGKIDVEEEFQQACFHLSVYRAYGTARHVQQHQLAQVKVDARVPAASVEVGGPDPETEETR